VKIDSLIMMDDHINLCCKDCYINSSHLYNLVQCAFCYKLLCDSCVYYNIDIKKIPIPSGPPVFKRGFILCKSCKDVNTTK